MIYIIIGIFWIFSSISVWKTLIYYNNTCLLFIPFTIFDGLLIFFSTLLGPSSLSIMFFSKLFSIKLPFSKSDWLPNNLPTEYKKRQLQLLLEKL